MRVVDRKTVRQIASAMGVSVGTVANDLEAAREERKPKDTDELIAYANGVLDAVLSGMLPGAENGDSFAAQAVVKALHEHASINGYHAPAKTELSASGETLAALFAELERRGGVAK